MTSQDQQDSQTPHWFTAREVLRTSKSIWTRNFSTLFCITLVFHLPLVLGAGLTFFRPISNDRFAGWRESILGTVLYFFTTAAVIHAVERIRRGNRADAWESIRDSLVQGVSVLGVGFVTYLVLWLPGVCVFIALLASSSGLGDGLFHPLLLLGIALSLHFLCVMWAALPAVVCERMDVSVALRRSHELTIGHKWRILGLILLVFVFLVIATGPGVALSETHPALGSVVQLIGTLVVVSLAATINAVGFQDLHRAYEGVDAPEPDLDPPERGQLAVGVAILLVSSVVGLWPA